MESKEIKEHIKRKINGYEEKIELMQSMLIGEGLKGERRQEQIEEVEKMYLRENECIDILMWITRKEGLYEKKKI